MNNVDKRTKIIIRVFLILAIILFSCLVIFGHDYHFHLNRLGAIAEELKTKPFNIPIRMLSNVYNGYGYGVPLFYGDFLLYIPALLSLLGLKLINSYKIVIISIFILTYFSMYKNMLITTNEKELSMVTAALYVFSPYFLIDLCFRQALAEAQSFMFIPIVVFSFYRMINNSKRKEYLYLSIGMSGIALSHNITFVLVILILAIWSLIEYKKVFKKKALANIIGAAVITILVTASFTFPMIEAMFSQKYQYQVDPSLNKESFVLNVINVRDLFVPDEVSRGLDRYFGIGKASELWKPGAICLNLFFIVIVLLKNRNKNKIKNINLLMLSIAIYVVIMIKPVVGLIGNFLSFIQFPWRLLIIPTLCISIFAGGFISGLKKNKNIILIIVILCGFFSVAPRYAYQAFIQYKGKDYAVSIDKNYLKDYTFDYDKNRLDYLYLPVETENDLFITRGDVVLYNGKSMEYERINNKLIIDLDNEVNCGSLELPLFYYKGYEASCDGENINIVKSKNGLVQVEIDDNIKGKITIEYKGTKIQKISNYISIVSVIFVAIAVLKNNKSYLKQ